MNSFSSACPQRWRKLGILRDEFHAIVRPCRHLSFVGFCQHETHEVAQVIRRCGPQPVAQHVQRRHGNGFRGGREQRWSLWRLECWGGCPSPLLHHSILCRCCWQRCLRPP